MKTLTISSTIAFAALAVLAVVHPTVAHAASPIPVTVETEGCAELEVEALREQIAVELGASFVVTSGALQPGSAHAAVRCQPPGAALVSLSWDHTTEGFTVEAPLSPRAAAVTVASRLQRVIARRLEGPAVPVAANVVTATPVLVTDGKEARAAHRIMIPGIIFLSAAGLCLTVGGVFGIWHLNTTKDDGVLAFYSMPFAVTGAIFAAIGLPLAIVGGVRANRAKHWTMKPQVSASLNGLGVRF
jgi:hypothetical protein